MQTSCKRQPGSAGASKLRDETSKMGGGWLQMHTFSRLARAAADIR
jgi:hypothetical protein